MSLARAWMRQLFGASGMALLVPGTIAGALAVLAFAGGFSRFNAIDQAFSGPAGPPAAAGSEARASARLSRTLVTLGRSGLAPVRVAAPDARGHVVLSGTGAPVRAGSRPVGTTPRTPPPGTHPRDPGRGHLHHGHTGPPTPALTTTTPVPAARATLGDGVALLGTAVAAKLPGPVGAATSSALQALGSTLKRVLPAPLGARSS